MQGRAAVKSGAGPVRRCSRGALNLVGPIRVESSCPFRRPRRPVVALSSSTTQASTVTVRFACWPISGRRRRRRQRTRARHDDDDELTKIRPKARGDQRRAESPAPERYADESKASERIFPPLHWMSPDQRTMLSGGGGGFVPSLIISSARRRRQDGLDSPEAANSAPASQPLVKVTEPKATAAD